MNKITAETLYKERKKNFSFKIITGQEFLRQRKITTYDVFRPGLALAGYTGYFLSDRIMIIGKTETSYLKTFTYSIFYIVYRQTRNCDQLTTSNIFYTK